MMQAHRSDRTNRHAEYNWVLFLMRSTLLCACVLLGSAAIMWVAANWQYWAYIKRIALVLGGFTISLIIAARTGQHHPKDWAKPFSVSSVLLALAAVLIGAVLALLSQNYHSGADSWQLFAWWALLLLPWALGLQSAPIILLCWFITNIGLSLLIVTSVGLPGELPLYLGLAGWNMLAYILFGWVSRRKPAVGQPMGAASYSFFAFSWAFATVEAGQQLHPQGLLNWPWLVGLGLLIILSLIQQRRQAFLLAILGYCAAGVSLVLHLMIVVVPQTGLGLYALLLVPLAALIMFAQLRRMMRRMVASSAKSRAAASSSPQSAAHAHEATVVDGGLKATHKNNSTPAQAVSATAKPVSPPATQNAGHGWWWPVRSVRFLVLAVAAVFWVSFLSVWGKLPLPVFAWLLLAFAVVLGLARLWQKEGWAADLWLMTWLGALISMTAVWMQGGIGTPSLVVLLGFSALSYWWTNASTVRGLTAGWFIFVLWAWPWIHPKAALWQVHQPQLDLRLSVLLLAVFLGTGLYYWLNPRQQRWLRPLLAAAWFWLVVINLVVWWAVVGLAPAGFQLSMFTIVATFVGGISLWFILPTTLTLAGKVLALLAAWCLAFIWWPVPWLFLCLVAFLYSAYRRQNTGISLFGFLFLLVLARWYDATYISLLEKAGRLLLSAGVLGLLALTLSYVFGLPLGRVGGSSNAQRKAPLSISRSAGLSLLAGALAVYGSAGWYVYGQEQILRHGTRFDLALMPADPRSLIQGDYMALDFALNQSIRLLQYQHPEIDWPQLRLKIWVRPSRTYGSYLYAIQLAGDNYLVQRADNYLYAQGPDLLPQPVKAFAGTASRPQGAHFVQGSPHAPRGLGGRTNPHPNFHLVPMVNQEPLQTAIPITMEKKFGRWTPDGVNAWFFTEGQGLSFAQAKWGRFKANGRGAVVLESLLNAQKDPIE